MLWISVKPMAGRESKAEYKKYCKNLRLVILSEIIQSENMETHGDMTVIQMIWWELLVFITILKLFHIIISYLRWKRLAVWSQDFGKIVSDNTEPKFRTTRSFQRTKTLNLHSNSYSKFPWAGAYTQRFGHISIINWGLMRAVIPSSGWKCGVRKKLSIKVKLVLNP